EERRALGHARRQDLEVLETVEVEDDLRQPARRGSPRLDETIVAERLVERDPRVPRGFLEMVAPELVGALAVGAAPGSQPETHSLVVALDGVGIEMPGVGLEPPADEPPDGAGED